jgi:hypothetical protein
MGQHSKKLTMHEPVACRIRFQGVLDQKWSDYMGGLTISLDTESGPHPVTTLTGELLDQAALMGVLDHLYGLLLPLISVECAPVGRET